MLTHFQRAGPWAQTEGEHFRPIGTTSSSRIHSYIVSYTSGENARDSGDDPGGNHPPPRLCATGLTGPEGVPCTEFSSPRRATRHAHSYR